MDKKIKLPHLSLIATLGIVLALINVYVPMLGILGLAIPVPYAIISTLLDKRSSIIALIGTFFILMFLVNPIYAISICIMSVVPGIVIGNVAKQQINEENTNRFEPIYIGTIAVVVSMILFLAIANVIFGNNIIEETLNITSDTIMSLGVDLGEDLNAESIVDYVRNMLPTALFIQGMIVAFIIYYLEGFILKRTRRLDLRIPKFEEFYLPGNAVLISFITYLFVMFIGAIGVNLHTGLIMINLQLVYNFMFMIQGIALVIYYFKKWVREGTKKKVFMSTCILVIFGVLSITFAGMLDCIMDFRKVRSHKST